jgi:hypothetical protein
MVSAMSTGIPPLAEAIFIYFSNIIFPQASYSTNPAHFSKGGQGKTPLSPTRCRHVDVSSKLVSTIVSTFTAYYVHLWGSFFSETPLSPPLPSFDGRAVQYPSAQNLRDYMSWRQVDCQCPRVRMNGLWLTYGRSHK